MLVGKLKSLQLQLMKVILPWRVGLGHSVFFVRFSPLPLFFSFSVLECNFMNAPIA